MTKHEQKKQAYQDRVARHKAGLCVECDKEPSLNQDGTTGLRCDEHKRKWLGNRSRVSAELKAEIPQTQYRVRRSSEEIDELHERRSDAAARKVLSFIEKHDEALMAAISREFPRVRPFIKKHERATVSVILTAYPETLPFIKAYGEMTVGALKREFPEYERLIWSVLKNLKITGKVIYNEHAAAPTWVRVGSMARVLPKVTGYNNNATFSPANPRTDPSPDSLYGIEHARQF